MDGVGGAAAEVRIQNFDDGEWIDGPCMDSGLFNGHVQYLTDGGELKIWTKTITVCR